MPHGPVELDQPSYNDGARNDWRTTSTLEKEGKCHVISIAF